jgi:hypothetical protein
MSLLIQIAIPIGVGLAVLAIGYCFRMRQLYLVVSRLFQYSKLSKSAKTMELIIVNRGRQSEEDIRIEFDPSYTYRMIALTSPTIKLEGSVLQIQRIPPRDEVSVVLETTNKNFSKKNVAAISSKTSKGKILEKIQEVPPNAGNTALVIGAFILIPTLMWFSADEYFKYKEQKGKPPVQDVSKTGWKNLDDYAKSTLAGFYLDGKFPVEIKGYRRVKDRIFLGIELINNTDEWLSFGVNVVSPAGESDNFDPRYKTYIQDVMVAPKGTLKQSFNAYLPAKFSHQFLLVQVNIEYQGKLFYRLEKQVDISQQK